MSFSRYLSGTSVGSLESGAPGSGTSDDFDRLGDPVDEPPPPPPKLVTGDMSEVAPSSVEEMPGTMLRTCRQVM